MDRERTSGGTVQAPRAGINRPESRLNPPQPSPWRRRAIIGGGVLAGLALIAGLLWAFARPALVDAVARERLDRVEERLGVSVRYSSLTLEGGDRVRIEGLEVSRRPELAGLDPAPLLIAPQVEIDVDVWGSLTGEAPLQAIRLESPVVVLVRDASGASDLDPVVAWAQERLDRFQRGDKKGEDADGGGRPLPALELHQGSLRVVDRFAPGGAPPAGFLAGWLARGASPLSGAEELELTVELVEGRPGPGGRVRGSAKLLPAPKHPWAPSVPERVDLTVDWPEDAAGMVAEVAATPSWHLGALPGLDGCGATFRAVGWGPAREATLRDLHVDGPESCPLNLKAGLLAVEPGSGDQPLQAVRLEDATAELEGGGELRSRLLLALEDHGADTEAPAPAETLEAGLVRAFLPAKVILRDGALTVWEAERGSAKLLELRGAGAEIERAEGDALSGRLSAEFGAEGSLSLEGTAGLKRRQVDLQVNFEHVAAGQLQQALGGAGRLWQAGELSGALHVQAGRADAPWSLTGHVRGDGLALEHHRLAATPITGLSLGLKGAASWEPASRTFRFKEGELTLGAAALRFDVDLEGLGHGGEDAALDLKRLRFKVALPTTDAQPLFAQLPEAFKSQLSAMRFRGKLGFRLEADIDTRNISAMKTDGDLDTRDLAVDHYDPRADVRSLRGAFSHTATQPETDYVFSIVASPEEDAQWVPLSRVSPYVAKGVFTNEDGSFYKHKGFSWLQVKSSVEDNLEAGRFRRGASTLSMQLIKNLFLSSEKTLSRKFQEALLTFAMEQIEAIPKDRILEIYLNIIEWGPKVYGIRAASLHYFGVHPEGLSLPEAVYLVTIIPGPRKYHSHYARGEISDSWWDRIQRLMKIMLDRGHITQDEYDEGLKHRPTFWKGSGLRPPPTEVRAPVVVPIDDLFP